MTDYTLVASSDSYSTTGATTVSLLYNRVMVANPGSVGSSLEPFSNHVLHYAHDNNILFKSIYGDTTIAIEVSGTSTPLSVTSTAHDVVVHAETDGSGNCISTIGEVVDIINNTPAASLFIFAVVDNGVDPDTLCTAMSEIGFDEALFQYYYVGSHLEDQFRCFFQMDANINNMVHVPYVNLHNPWSISVMMDPEPNPWI